MAQLNKTEDKNADEIENETEDKTEDTTEDMTDVWTEDETEDMTENRTEDEKDDDEESCVIYILHPLSQMGDIDDHDDHDQSNDANTIINHPTAGQVHQDIENYQYWYDVKQNQWQPYVSPEEFFQFQWFIESHTSKNSI
ncbi:hypothetical protein BDD12DRAFT_877281 [Trichophaea hybrida]|nr:hypothetical protein BDD12DRAFT_877281 [Trichophaea hybrida]